MAAVNGVTASCHQLWLSLRCLLIDWLGFFQGAERQGGAGGRGLAVTFNLERSRLCIAARAIDHMRLPGLIAARL